MCNLDQNSKPIHGLVSKDLDKLLDALLHYDRDNVDLLELITFFGRELTAELILVFQKPIICIMKSVF